MKSNTTSCCAVDASFVVLDRAIRDQEASSGDSPLTPRSGLPVLTFPTFILPTEGIARGVVDKDLYCGRYPGVQNPGAAECGCEFAHHLARDRRYFEFLRVIGGTDNGPEENVSLVPGVPGQR